ncbi:hypothetical protein AAFF_G00166960 [Aldrovandia affinis]|uniref:Uncharacterized protein n=1 Tax=Aldrovandia affinis TaxID=143900 RepID=A0AAD7RMB1_9TELE|nr:hypothetical protein AAFF_G00166960 [Aldrovandia affinis]
MECTNHRPCAALRSIRSVGNEEAFGAESRGEPTARVGFRRLRSPRHRGSSTTPGSNLEEGRRRKGYYAGSRRTQMVLIMAR